MRRKAISLSKAGGLFLAWPRPLAVISPLGWGPGLRHGFAKQLL